MVKTFRLKTFMKLSIIVHKIGQKVKIFIFKNVALKIILNREVLLILESVPNIEESIFEKNVIFKMKKRKKRMNCFNMPILNLI